MFTDGIYKKNTLLLETNLKYFSEAINYQVVM